MKAGQCLLYVSGGRDAQRVYVSLVDAADGTEYTRIAGKDHNLFEAVIVDTSAYKGKSVIVRVVDQSADEWGHINFGGLVFAAPDRDR